MAEKNGKLMNLEEDDVVLIKGYQRMTIKKIHVASPEAFYGDNTHVVIEFEELEE